MKRTDEDIQQAVLRELAWDRRVPSAHIGVMIDGGVVTLTGEVTTLAARLAAQQAAHRVLGVRDVANSLVVRPAGGLARPDTLLAQAVRQALERAATVPAERIQTAVSDGWVTLDGQVDNEPQRVAVERTVGMLAGVRGVTNQLVIAPAAAAAAALRQRTESAEV